MTVGVLGLALPTWWPSEAKKFLRDYLEEYLIDRVDPADDTRAGIVVIGRYRDNPTKDRIVLEVHENDPDDAGGDWEHRVMMLNRNDDNPQYSNVIGRSRNRWYRRFTIKITIMLRGNNQEEADQIKGAVMHRIEQLLLDYPQLAGLTDSGGEVALEGHIVRETGQPSGDDRSPIWRHKLWLEILTNRSR